VSIALFIITAVLGESAAVLPPGGPPPFSAAARPSAELVTLLLAAAIALGVGGLVGVWRALRHGWVPRTRPLMVVSTICVAAFVLLPIMGSADAQSYAAYGRMVVVGVDPYATTPAQLGGPYGSAVEAPWEHTASVYGPIATAEQAAAAWLAGDNPKLAMFLLSLFTGLAFIAVSALLLRLARTPTERARVAWMWALNPLLLFELVAGAHVDTLVVLAAVAGLWAARRNRLGSALLAGLLCGVACAIKATAALVGAGLAWALSSAAIMRQTAGPHPQNASRSRKGGRARAALGVLAALAAGAAAIVVPAYLLAGPHVFDQLQRASKFVSFAVPWRFITGGLDRWIGLPTSRPLLRVAALVAAAALAWFLARGLPGRRDTELAAARSSLVLVLAWLLTATYVLPWYDGLAWALIVLLPATAFDLLLLAHTASLALAYLPGRVVPLDEPLRTALDVWKSGASPVVLLVLVIGAVLTARHAAAQQDHRVSISPTEAAMKES
jgi:hypothetical protein